MNVLCTYWQCTAITVNNCTLYGCMAAVTVRTAAVWTFLHSWNWTVFDVTLYINVEMRRTVQSHTDGVICCLIVLL